MFFLKLSTTTLIGKGPPIVLIGIVLCQVGAGVMSLLVITMLFIDYLQPILPLPFIMISFMN